MKKRNLAFLCVLVLSLVMLVLASCNTADTSGIKYSINTEHFDSVVPLGGKPNIDTITVQKTMDESVEQIKIQLDMIEDWGDTSVVGETSLAISYRGRRYTVPYTVKYQVSFVSFDEVISTQLVLSSDEISVPTPEKENYIFKGWDISIPETLSENLTFVALFDEVTPALVTLEATYGDTLADLTLPEGVNGKWQFVDALSTPVGAVGEQTFAVEFFSSNTNAVTATDTVCVNVKKATLTFENIVDTFVYDGGEHHPTYTLPVDVDVITLGEGAKTDVGTYSFGFVVNDPNYEGVYQGTYRIEKATVTVTLGSYNMVWGNPMPTVEYTVSGFENENNILGISVVMPTPTAAGDYPISATVSNQNVDATVVDGVLTVTAGTLDVGTPTIQNTSATFGDKLFALTFGTHPNGTWSWDETLYNADTTVGDAGTNTFRAVFTPTSSLYEKAYADISVTVSKKQLIVTVGESSFVYDGVAKMPTCSVSDSDGNIYTDLSLTLSETCIDAGVYNVTLSLSEKNYEGAASFQLVIMQATPEVDFSHTFSIKYKPSLTLADITLPEGYAWAVPSTSLGAIESKEYAVIYTPADKNYKSVEGALSVTVTKGDASIENVDDTYTSVYNGKAYNLLLSSDIYSTSNGAITLSILRGTEAVSEIVNAGTYTVTLTLAETDFYLGAVAQTTVVIEKAENTDTVNQNQSATYGDTLGMLSVPTSNYGTWAFVLGADAKVGDAGVSTFELKFTSQNENYNDRIVTVTVTVAKKALTPPTVSNKAYTGVEQKSGLVGTELYTVTEDIGGTAVGTYTVTLSLVDFDNYKWTTTDTREVEISYTITSTNNEWVTAPSISGWTYGDDANAPVAQALYGSFVVEYKVDRDGAEYSEEVPSAAGNYIAKFTTTDQNATTLVTEVKFSISKRSVDIPVLSQNSFVYTGEKIYAPISSTSLYSVSDEGGVVVGEYEVLLTLLDSTNYKWADDASGAQRKLAYSITKANAEFVGELVLDGWTYGESANTPAIGATFGTPVFKYATSIDGEYTEAVPENAGTYYIKAYVGGTDNYNGIESEPKAFTIAKASATIVAEDTYTFTYNGKEFTVSGTPSHSEREILYTITLNGETVEEILFAGEYTVVMTLAESENYLAVEKTVSVSVLRADNTDTVNQNQNATYGDTLGMLSVPTSECGTWAFVLGADTKVGDVGVNTFDVKFTPNNTNYNERIVTVTVNVAKKTVSIPAVSDKAYTGQTQTSGLVDTDLYTVLDAGGVEIQEYTATLTLCDAENYAWEGKDGASVTVTYWISAAPNAWVEGKEPTVQSPVTFGDAYSVIAEAVYGDVLVEYKKATDDDSAYTTTKPTAAGSYTVRFTTTDENYTILQATRPLVIQKKSVDVPTLSDNSFVYTGEVFDLGVASGDLYTVSGHEEVNFGTYTVTFTLVDSDNYTWSDGEGESRSATYEIQKATVTVSTPVISGWTYGEEANAPSATTNLAANLTFLYAHLVDGVYSEEVPKVAGTYYLKAVSSGDNENYIYTESEVVSFTIAKANGEILGAENSYSTTYTGDAYEIPNISASHSESELVYVYTKGGVEVSSIVDAGVYQVTITLPESDNYSKASITVSVSVLPVTNTDEVDTEQSATYGDTLANITLPTNANGVWELVDGDGNVLDKSASVGNVGTYTLLAKFHPTSQNFDTREVEITLTVSKRTVSTPTLSGKVYNGTLQTADIESGELYTVTENAGGVNVGTYDVTLTLNDSVNYRFADSESNTLELTFEITMAQNEWITSPSISSSWKYGETGDAGSAAAKYDTLVIEYKLASADDSTYTTTLPTATGSYIARFRTVGANASELSTTISFTIQKQTVSIPTMAQSEFDYDGAFHNSGLSANEYYTLTDVGGTDSGEYTVTLELIDPDNYIWNDGKDGATRTFTYKIVPASVTVTIDNTWGGFVYGSFTSPTVTSDTTAEHTLALYYATERGGTYLPFDAASCANLDAGSYWLRACVEGNVNLAGESYVQFTVTPAPLTFADFTYSGGPYYENSLPSLVGYNLVTFGGAEVAGTFTMGAVNFVDGGTSTVSVTFVPTSKNFEQTPLVATMSISLKTVATVGHGGTGYGTIENALAAAATSGGTVYVIPDTTGNVVIKDPNASVPSNVTLILPWGTGASDYNTPNTDGHYVATYNGDSTGYGGLSKLSRTLLVKLADGVTLTVNGTLTVAGELSGGGGGSEYAGHTAVKYAELQLGADAKIIVNGTLHAFGFVTESETDNGSKITVEANAKVYQPFVIRDFLGGSRLYYIYSKGKSTSTIYKRFIFMNIHSEIEYKYQSSLMVAANLYAGDQHNPTTATMIGSTSSSVIQMVEGGYVIAKYDPTSEVCDLDIYGGASTNGMSLKVNTGIPLIGSVTANSNDFLFPLSYHYNITLNRTPTQSSASYTMSQDFQMLPGSSLTVGEGVHLTIGKVIIFDKTYRDAGDGTANYPTQNPYTSEVFDDAKLTVHGTMSASALGGTVIADNTGDVSITTRSYSSKDLYTAETGGLSGSFQATRTLVAMISSGGRTYTWLFGNSELSDVTGKTLCTVTFEPNGGNGGTQAGYVVQGEAMTLLAAITKDSTKEKKFENWSVVTYVTTYTFAGWSDGSTTYAAGASYVPTGNVTLTAQWTSTTTKS